MSGKQKPHVEAHADLASGIGTAHDATTDTVYRTSGSEAAQRELGRRLAPPNKEANAKRSANAEAARTLALRLRSEHSNTKQLIHALAAEFDVEETASFASKVYRWLREARAE